MRFFVLISLSKGGEGNEIERTRKKKGVERAVARMAKKSASVEANTACPCWGYQSQEPKQVKALRKF